MRLFRNKKSCRCIQICQSQTVHTAEQIQTDGTEIKLLGSGCAKCSLLEAKVQEALTQLCIHATIHHVTDFAQIAAYGVMTTPALVVDGKVIFYGKVPAVPKIVELLKKARQ